MDQVKSADGTRIAFEKLGSGPPLILLGGAFCDHRARAAGLPLARPLASAFTVFCVDRRGRNESTDTAPYAPAREVEDVAALVQAAGGTAYVYGHSSGATLALESALAGLPITRLALYEPPLVLAASRETLPADFPRQLAELANAGRRADAAELFLTRAVGVPAPYVQQMKAGPVWPALEALAHTLTYDATLTQNPESLLTRAEQLQTPCLLLDGSKSQPWMRAGVVRLAQAIKGSLYGSLPDQTHDVNPELLAAKLAEFFGK